MKVQKRQRKTTFTSSHHIVSRWHASCSLLPSHFHMKAEKEKTNIIELNIKRSVDITTIAMRCNGNTLIVYTLSVLCVFFFYFVRVFNTLFSET